MLQSIVCSGVNDISSFVGWETTSMTPRYSSAAPDIRSKCNQRKILRRRCSKYSEAALENRWGTSLVTPLANRTREQSGRVKEVAGFLL